MCSSAAKGKELARLNKDLGDEEASRNRIQDHLRLRKSRQRVHRLSKEVAKAKKAFEGEAPVRMLLVAPSSWVWV